MESRKGFLVAEMTHWGLEYDEVAKVANICDEYISEIRHQGVVLGEIQDECNSKVEKLQEKLNTRILKNWKLQAKVTRLELSLKDRHPNTCPLCEGDGEWENNVTLITDLCPCCKGKGTV